MEDPFPSSLSSSLLDHYATSGCTFAEMLDYSDKSSSLGFMELLEFGDSAPEDLSILPDRKLVQESSEVLNAPPTPNYSSISSESSDALKDEHVKEEDEVEEEEDEVDDDKKKTTKKQLKVKKTNEKKKREERFAFMTKSEVDHLEDGYRWRKYGQKAVKNSPFPRSYYRCTNATCNVKKRVERSCTDPSIVVTTYEGQHTHPSPQMHRPPAPPPPPPYPAAHNHQLMNYLSGYMGGGGGAQQLSFCSQPPGLMADKGLLQDIVSWPMPIPMPKREEQ